MGRAPCCEKEGLKKGPWTPEEDQKLLVYIDANGHGSWRSLPEKAGLQRCGKSCRLRWTNYLRPDIKRGKFTAQEEQTIIQLHALLGNRWSAIATHLPKRTDNEIKNHWNTHLKKRLTKMGIDPVTHKLKGNALDSLHGQTREAVNLSHMAQWESARIEAEARLVRESKLRLESIRIHSESSILTQNQNQHTPGLDILKAWKRLVTWNASATDLTTRYNESPTSTSSSVESAFTTQNTKENRKSDFLLSDNREMKEWKEFAKLMNTINEERQNSSEFSWLQESPGKFIHGFSDLLVESSDLKISENIAVEIYRNINEEEEGRTVWNTIFDMANAVSPTNSEF